jgi:hypothetical protein
MEIPQLKRWQHMTRSMQELRRLATRDAAGRRAPARRAGRRALRRGARPETPPIGGADGIDAMRVMIDGMNLALEQGTGVATYARNLVSCLRREGREVAILYGRNVTAHRDPLLREVAFFNAAENRGRSKARVAFDMARAMRPLRPYAVPDTGLVLRRELAARFPPADALYNLPSLFQIALSKFEAGLGMLEIETPEPVDVAHWTYPMPLRVRGARNVYTLHDLVPLKMPYATLDHKSRYWRLMRAIALGADAIATVSEASRRDILEMLPVEPERVHVTHQSVVIPKALLETPETELAQRPDRGPCGRRRARAAGRRRQAGVAVRGGRAHDAARAEHPLSRLSAVLAGDHPDAHGEGGRIPLALRGVRPADPRGLRLRRARHHLRCRRHRRGRRGRRAAGRSL